MLYPVFPLKIIYNHIINATPYVIILHEINLTVPSDDEPFLLAYNTANKETNVANKADKTVTIPPDLYSYSYRCLANQKFVAGVTKNPMINITHKGMDKSNNLLQNAGAKQKATPNMMLTIDVNVNIEETYESRSDLYSFNPTINPPEVSAKHATEPIIENHEL